MTRQLLFVHGRAQEHKDPGQLKAEWTDAWRAGLAKSALDVPLAECDIRFPYYGQTLWDLAEGVVDAADVIVRGEGADRAYEEFMVSVLGELCRGARITDDQVFDGGGLNVRERGPRDWAWVKATLSALETHVPGLSGASIAVAVHDVYHYLKNPGVRDEIDIGVRDAVVPGRETVVVGHSLGSVVSYSLLRRDAKALGWRVPLYVTLGSPLAVTAIRNALRPLIFPAVVGSWLNVMDTRDVVALGPLDERHRWVSGIENKTDVRNPTANRHGISGYLDDAEVARRIHDALLAP